MSNTYTQGGYTVDVAPDGAITVKSGDSLSKYSMAMFGNFDHVQEYARLISTGLLEPVYKRNVNLIQVGETLYHEPTYRLGESPADELPAPDFGECPREGSWISQTWFRTWTVATSTAIVSALPHYTDWTSLSHLMEPMLRTYLNGGGISSSLQSQIQAEVSRTKAFGRLVFTVENAIAAERAKLGRNLTQAELALIAGQTVNKSYRDPLTGKMMYFYNDDRGMQGVIGGIHDLHVSNVVVTGNAYQIDVVIKDKYDFVNKQSTSNDPDLAAYVRYRENLDNLIKCGAYDRFVREVTTALTIKVDNVSRSRAVAAYFYALELNNYTPGGFAWDVTVPICGHMN